MRARYSNDVFFAAARGRANIVSIPEDAFYASRPRPAAQPQLIEIAASTPMRFALLLFVAGWGGILFQKSFFQQIVFGAPVFEEFAKLGLALFVAVLLRARSLWITLPLAWASGAAFGVFEHFSTYVEEDLASYIGRVAFHTGATGLSMLFFHAFLDFSDVRARWAATAPATLFHWANNFAALMLGLTSLAFPFANVIAAGWSFGITFAIWVSTLAALAMSARFKSLATLTLERMMPRLGLERARAPAPLPAASEPQ